MTINELPRSAAAGGESVRYPVTAGEIIGAIYRIAFRHRDEEALFARARVEWADLPVPFFLLVFLSLILATIGAKYPASSLLLVLDLAFATLRAAIAAGLTWTLGAMFTTPERGLTGTLVYSGCTSCWCSRGSLSCARASAGTIRSG